jgi:fructokinase
MILVLGEALIDLIVGDDPRHPTACPGGSPANTAIAIARLGTPVAFAGRFGSDRFGDLLLANLIDNGVDLRYAVEATEAASLAVVTTGTGGGPSYGFHVAGTADWMWSAAELPATLPADVRVVHTGSLAIAMPPGARELAAWFTRQRGSRITSLDPNIRPDLVGERDAYLPRLEALVAASHLVKVSADDLAWAYPDIDPVAAATRWQRELGPTLVVVTLGAEGAVAVHGGRTVHRSALPVSIVDTVGAGDAFYGGLIHALATQDLLDEDRLADLTDDELTVALDYACATAALACGRSGANPPYRDQVDAILLAV